MNTANTETVKSYQQNDMCHNISSALKISEIIQRLTDESADPLNRSSNKLHNRTYQRTGQQNSQRDKALAKDVIFRSIELTTTRKTVIFH